MKVALVLSFLQNAISIALTECLEVLTLLKKTMNRKPRILCLHGFGGSGKIIRQELESRWPKSITSKFDFFFLDGPFPEEEKSPEKGRYDPPYYIWFRSLEEYGSENFNECMAYIETHMRKSGPFDGVLGFSQGAILGAALPGMQAEGVVLNDVPRIKSVIVLSGGKFGGIRYPAPKLAENAYPAPRDCLSVHFIGDMDYAKPDGLDLIDMFTDPIVINHTGEHRVPKLDEKGVEIMLSFIEKLQTLL